ncbi:MAG: hypothetical protein V1755_03190, partial [Chloroflexota bacterium]
MASGRAESARWIKVYGCPIFARLSRVFLRGLASALFSALIERISLDDMASHTGIARDCDVDDQN